MISDSTLSVDDTSDISIKVRHLNVTRWLWYILTRKYFNRSVVTTNNMKRCQTMLHLTNTHLQGYEPEVNIQTSH